MRLNVNAGARYLRLRGAGAGAYPYMFDLDQYPCQIPAIKIADTGGGANTCNLGLEWVQGTCDSQVPVQAGVG